MRRLLTIFLVALPLAGCLDDDGPRRPPLESFTATYHLETFLPQRSHDVSIDFGSARDYLRADGEAGQAWLVTYSDAATPGPEQEGPSVPALAYLSPGFHPVRVDYCAAGTEVCSISQANWGWHERFHIGRNVWDADGPWVKTDGKWSLAYGSGRIEFADGKLAPTRIYETHAGHEVLMATRTSYARTGGLETIADTPVLPALAVAPATFWVGLDQDLFGVGFSPLAAFAWIEEHHPEATSLLQRGCLVHLSGARSAPEPATLPAAGGLTAENETLQEITFTLVDDAMTQSFTAEWGRRAPLGELGFVASEARPPADSVHIGCDARSDVTDLVAAATLARGVMQPTLQAYSLGFTHINHLVTVGTMGGMVRVDGSTGLLASVESPPLLDVDP